jgi:hypothetical protein
MMALEAFVQGYNILLELNLLFLNLYLWNVLPPKHDTLLAIDPAWTNEGRATSFFKK